MTHLRHRIKDAADWNEIIPLRTPVVCGKKDGALVCETETSAYKRVLDGRYVVVVHAGGRVWPISDVRIPDYLGGDWIDKRFKAVG